MISMINGMIIRLVICTISIGDHPCLMWTHILCSHICLANMHIMDLMHVHLP